MFCHRQPQPLLKLLIVLNGIEIIAPLRPPCGLSLLIVLNGIEMKFLQGQRERVYSLLIVLNGIEIKYKLQ